MHLDTHVKGKVARPEEQPNHLRHIEDLVDIRDGVYRLDDSEDIWVGAVGLEQRNDLAQLLGRTQLRVGHYLDPGIGECDDLVPACRRVEWVGPRDKRFAEAFAFSETLQRSLERLGLAIRSGAVLEIQEQGVAGQALRLLPLPVVQYRRLEDRADVAERNG